MDQLLPIIRRQRRPLVVSDAPPAAAVNVEPANAVARPARTAKGAKEAKKLKTVESTEASPSAQEATD